MKRGRNPGFRNIRPQAMARRSKLRNSARCGAELIVASALLAVAGHDALASSVTWIGNTSADFSTTANWSNNPTGVSGQTGANLYFGATGNNAPVNDLTGQTWPTFNFLSGSQAYDITGNGFTLSAGSASSMINSGTSTQTIAVPVTLAGSHTVDAATGSIDFTGGLTGTVGAVFGANPSLTTPGPTSTSTVVIDSAATYTASNTTAETWVMSGTLQIGTGGSIGSGGLYLGNSSAATTGQLILGDSTGPVSQTFTSIQTATSSLTGCSIVGGSSSDSTLNADITNAITYFGVIGGSGTNQNNINFIKSGTGTLTLHTSNTYAGSTTIQAGRLISDAATAIPTNTALTLGDNSNDSATLDLYNTTVTVSNITSVGTGTLAIGTGYTGTATKAIFDFNGGSNFATFAGIIYNALPGIAGTTSSTEVEAAGGTLSLTNTANAYSSGTLLNPNGTIEFASNTLGTGPIFLDGGTLLYAPNNTQDVSTSQTITLNVNGGTVNTNSNNVTFASPIIPAAANGGFTKAGLGTLTLSAVNTYTKTTTVGGGTLLIGSTGAIASTAINVQAAGTLTVNGSIGTAAAMTDNGVLNSNIPTIEIASLNGAGTVNLNANTLQIDGGGTFSGTIADGNSGGSVLITGGSMTLSGSNTYTGGTTVNGGSLIANNTTGSATGSGTVTLNGGILASGAAGGIITGPVSAGSGSHTIAPGGIGTVGTLTVGALTTTSNTTINFDLGTGTGPEITSNDLLTVGSGTSIGATTPITFGGTPVIGDDYRLIGGAISGINVNNFSLPAAPMGDQYYLSNNGVDPGYIDLVAAVAGPQSLTWNNGAGNNLWDNSSSANWNNGSSTTVFNPQDNVTFNDNNPSNTAANYAVTLNSTVTPGSVTVSNSNGNYTISGIGTIGGTGALTKSGTGTLTLATANTYSGGTSVSAGLLKIAPTSSTTSALPTGALSISGSGEMQLESNVTAGSANPSGPPATSNVNLTSLSITGSGVLDITNNHIIIDYTPGNDPISSIAAMIASGYAGDTWSGPGIISSLAASNPNYGVGYADSADPGNPAGLASGTIEIMYTLLGDANLDDKVNGADFTLMAANFNDSVTNGWDKGDFNYSGTVNGDDFVLLADNFNQFASQSSVASADLQALDSFAAANGISLASVPEPATMGLLTLGIAGVLARRRRV